MPPDEFRQTAYAPVDSIAAFLSTLAERPVATGESPGAIRALLNADERFPDEGTPAGAVLRTAPELLVGHSPLNGRPRLFA